MEKIPVTIITGFLGTGKTTLIRRICSEFVGKRVGVVQNEFSDFMGIEKPILLKTAASVYELPNGCLCCSAKSGLVSALDAFLELSERIDWILIEASGTADPVTLTGNLWLDDNLESKLLLNGVVSITDVSTLNQFNPVYPSLYTNQHSDSQLNKPSSKVESGVSSNTINTMDNSVKDVMGDLKEIFYKQLSVGDLIVVNKCDLLPLTEELRSFLLTFNPCKLVECVRCDFDLGLIFDLNTLDTKKLLSLNFENKMPKHVDSGFKSVYITSSKVYSLKYINDTIASLLWDSESVYRCKGIFKALKDCSVVDFQDGTESIFELQGIGKVFEVNVTDVAITINIFLFIGFNLNSKLLHQLFS